MDQRQAIAKPLYPFAHFVALVPFVVQSCSTARPVKTEEGNRPDQLGIADRRTKCEDNHDCKDSVDGVLEPGQFMRATDRGPPCDHE